MSSPAVNSLMQNLASKPLVNRAQHFSGPSGASIHHFHSSHQSKGGGGGGKHGIALSALTLLSFLFFLNILQNCLQEHMDSMAATPSQVQVIIQSRTKEVREMEAQKRKGEIEYYNTSNKESRNHPEISKTKLQEFTQIPVKLRTNEKAVKPRTNE